MDRFDPFVKYADVYGDIINWEKDPMNKPQNQNKYFFSDGKTYYEQICKMLRLMSVFKEAFNQIYSNEDEISEAWENFVNNLSASVVEGTEPDVTLTWTDDSVNFEFTMVPGVPGEQGVGITSISFNSDYTMTITLSDGNTYTSMSLKGETGPQGPQGETGSGLQILDIYPTVADLQSAHPTGQPGDAYQVGSEGSYTLYIWSSSQSAWVPAGSLGTVSPSVSNPLMDGTASAGSLDQYSRGDHVHPTDTSRASKEELDALIKTSQSLIDQSFTYRESPAIQDGLARIDKIKGNTLNWNQLVQNGNFADTNGWSATRGTIATSNNILSYTSTDIGGGATQNRLEHNLPVILANHKIFVRMRVKPAHATRCVIQVAVNGAKVTVGQISVNGNAWNDISLLYTLPYALDSGSNLWFGCEETSSNGYVIGDVDQYMNVMISDLTAMGLDISSPSDFTSLFSLPYYDFNQGSLLSFNGTGIKTVGKNLLNYEWLVPSSGNVSLNLASDYFEVSATSGSYRSAILNCLEYLPKGKTLYISANSTQEGFGGAYIQVTVSRGSSTQYIEIGNNPNNYSFIVPLDANSVNMIFYVSNGSMSGYGKCRYSNVIVSLSPITSFEPYTSSLAELPISQYFPTGMKDVPDYTNGGKIYDEMTSNKADARVGSVDLGSLTWTYESSIDSMVSAISDIKSPARDDVAFNGILPIARIIPASQRGTTTGIRAYIFHNENKLYIRESSYTDATAFKTAMSSVYLYYELATPTETAVDLDLDFMAYEDGTEQLLPVNGPVPSTSPIIADMTYMSIDDAMEYILEKLANVPHNTQQILESLEDDVSDLQTDVSALQPAVSALQTSVGNINTNIGQLSSTVAGHTASISDIQSDITDLNTGLSNIEDTVTDNTSRIGTLETDLASTDGQVQSLGSSVSTLSSTVSDQGTELGEIDSIIQDISNNPVISALGSHELGFVAAYVDATLPANTGTRVTIPKPVIFPNNYTPLFIVGMSTGAYDVSICEIPPTFGNSDSVNCRVWNHGSQKTTQITVYILCMRQRQSQ